MKTLRGMPGDREYLYVLIRFVTPSKSFGSAKSIIVRFVFKKTGSKHWKLISVECINFPTFQYMCFLWILYRHAQVATPTIPFKIQWFGIQSFSRKFPETYKTRKRIPHFKKNGLIWSMKQSPKIKLAILLILIILADGKFISLLFSKQNKYDGYLHFSTRCKHKDFGRSYKATFPQHIPLRDKVPRAQSIAWRGGGGSEGEVD